MPWGCLGLRGVPAKETGGSALGMKSGPGCASRSWEIGVPVNCPAGREAGLDLCAGAARVGDTPLL